VYKGPLASLIEFKFLESKGALRAVDELWPHALFYLLSVVTPVIAIFFQTRFEVLLYALIGASQRDLKRLCHV